MARLFILPPGCARFLSCLVRSRRIKYGLMVLTAFVLLIGVLDRIFPLPIPGRGAPFSTLVVARDGTPLRAFPDQEHVWRYPVTLQDLAPQYIDTLVYFEDRAFFYHPGINPFSLLRAVWQWLRNGRVISGGSTLTMQVARIIDNTRHTPSGKLRQILRALQLELHYSKREILTLYVNYVPMGGVLEGVEAGSRAYLGKSALKLTLADTALLTVLPQSPSRLRPDRYPARAQSARDKVLNRLRGILPDAQVDDAMLEPVIARTVREPLLAPLYAERVKRMKPGARRIDGTIDADIQQTVELLLQERVRGFPARVSAAALVVDNHTLEVLAYAGSADFGDERRFAYLDMAQASRSPGSTLKPFLYAFALDQGLVHSESLLSDTPQSFGGYRPRNFLENFNGPVGLSEALIRSLNVPAVEVLNQLGVDRFVAQLRQGGLKLDFPRGATPNLSVILGGAATTLENLVGAYTSLARNGMSGKPRLLPDAPLQERRMMSDGAAYIIRDILESGGQVARAVELRANTHGVAYKTGTSFGFRDAWAVGVNDRFTVGVWVGRPDGTPNPGFFGANVAAPLLLSIFEANPDQRTPKPRPVPATVSQQSICWPMGISIADIEDKRRAALCPIRLNAWLLNGAAPPTFPDAGKGAAASMSYYVDNMSRKRVMPDCTTSAYTAFETARWPSSLLPWISPALRERSTPPGWSPRCSSLYKNVVSIHIIGLDDGEWLRRAAGAPMPTVNLSTRGAESNISWIVNGRFMAHTAPDASYMLKFAETGRYDITSVDEEGNYDRISVHLTGANK
ncbi:penicillin-binding protein 1C [Herbaspirillum sp. RTI4]|uniref:penicillin-binding protein 1C n=1 Tax=Herbaspirillum sp. RTI4 TaxID=3048640 RepID=UPI002AB56D26|nr:penicillin-binding protein 1C [Herbaspirillum sp. RTI4]MDY7579021.1 penicillin-binding protein 1C [Herbaspirillum sp. RTI4]MEA9980952.1 penicillin-binding protein 1C [Herbaspirillum sp. RTI4]